METGNQSERVLPEGDEEVANAAATVFEVAVVVVEAQALDTRLMAQMDLMDEAERGTDTTRCGQ